MKKSYSTPTLSTRRMQLGVFGDYGQDGGSDVIPVPIKVIDRPEIRLE